MCYRWEDNIEACQNCSYHDFQQVLRAFCNTEPSRPTHRTIPQPTRRPLNADHPQSSKHDARENINKNMRVQNCGAQSGQPAEQQDPSSSSSLNSRTDWARRCRPKRNHEDSPSSPRDHSRTDSRGDYGHQGSSRKLSQKHSRAKETGDLTAGMNKLPSPSWENEQILLPLVQEQLRNEEFAKIQEQRQAEIWAPYERERHALAASHIPEMEETWTPDFEEEEILEREIPLEEEIWARSVHDGGVWMRSIMDENDTCPRTPPSPEEDEIWTRDNDGMLSSPRLKKILRIQELKASLEEERHERSDENVQASSQGPFISVSKREERDEVTPSFSEGDTSADYPP